MSKRKREDDSKAAGAPDVKKVAIEKPLSAAEKRQQRSERKSKKVQPPRQKVQAVPEELLPAKDGDDSFAGGDDFVALTDPTRETHNVRASETTKPKVKAKHKSKSAAVIAEDQPSADMDVAQEPNVKDTRLKKAKNAATSKETNGAESSRFIVFVGNLPFSTTTSQIQHHFRKLAPKAIRHSTDKATGKSRGFAFLEFDEYSAMKTCLKVYHHSLFDPERTAKLPESAFDENGLEIDAPEQDRKSKGRKINVELTAGGGGKGGQRTEKIKKKNEKLWEERERRKKGDMKHDKKKKLERSDANLTEIGTEAVHPSRMKRIPGRS